MCAASSPPPPVPLATWNPARGVWETPQVSLLCGHSVPYSDPWPTSGTTRSGSCFAPPTSEPRTGASGPSSRPGPPETLLKTPTSNIGKNGGSQHPAKRKSGGHGPNLADEVEWLLLPTPKASDGIKGSPNQRHGNGDMTLPSAAASLLPTPRASDTGTPGRRPGKGWRPPCRRWSCRCGRSHRRKPRSRASMGTVLGRHRPMGDTHPPRAGAHGRGWSAPCRLRRVDAGPRRRLGHRHPGTRTPGAAHRARQRRRAPTGHSSSAVAGATVPALSALRGRLAAP